MEGDCEPPNRFQIQVNISINQNYQKMYAKRTPEILGDGNLSKQIPVISDLIQIDAQIWEYEQEIAKLNQ